MKTMKKVISVLLLVCVLASFATVSAYAEEVSPLAAAESAAVPELTNLYEKSNTNLSAANGTEFTFCAPFTCPQGKSWSDYTILWSASDPTLVPISGTTIPNGNNENTVKCNTNTRSYAVNVTVTAQLRENATGNTSAAKTVTLTFPATAAPEPTPAPTITIKAAETSVRVGGKIQLYADLSANGNFAYWKVAEYESTNGATGTFDIASNRTVNFTAGNTPGTVKIYAYAKEGNVSDSITITITAARTPQVVCTVGRIDNGETATFWVNNAEDGETFTWSYVTSPATAQIITKANDRGVGLDLTGGKGEGTVTVTAKDKYGASGSVTVPVNVMDTGDAKLSPTNVTWSRGQGNLTFTVEPTMYSAYIDGVCITGSGNTNKYSYVYSSKNLVINSSYLATLSAGEHILRVDTVYNSGEGIGQGAGTVYAYITINGTASAAYGDNAHVRGTTGNLYFNSNGAIKNVYISNQLIDPANYTLSNNGKSVTLKANFLNLLNYGSYTMKLENTNGGTETATFRIVTANYAPATGDESNLAIWVAVMLISGVGAIALIPRRKKEM